MDCTHTTNPSSPPRENALGETQVSCESCDNELERLVAHNQATASQGGVPAKRRSKTRRGLRKDDRKWKPYSQLTWEEKAAQLRKEQMCAQAMLEAEQAAAKAPPPRRKRKAKLDACPPAPKNTTQFLIHEHEDDVDCHDTDTSGSASDGSTCSASVPYGFENDYEEAVYGEYDDMNRQELIANLRKQREELEELQATLRRKEFLAAHSDSPPPLSLSGVFPERTPA